MVILKSKQMGFKLLADRFLQTEISFNLPLLQERNRNQGLSAPLLKPQNPLPLLKPQNPLACLLSLEMEALDPDVFLADVETVEEQEEEELEWLSNKDAFPAVEICMLPEEEPNSISVTVERKNPKLNKSGRKCTHCGMTQTQMWRKGPLGDRTLCNPCGIRYRSGRLCPEYRPANSPTFSSELHSYRHSEVLHRRQNKYGAAAEPFHKCTTILAKSKKNPSPAVETLNTSGQPSSIIISEQQSPVSVLKDSKNSSTTVMSSCETLTIPHRPRSKGLHKRSAIPWQQVGIGRSRMTITTELMLVTLDIGDGTFITKTLCNACHQWFKYGCKISDGLDIGRKCLHCGTGETSLWRSGPLGSKTLCEACGLQWYVYGELKPDYRRKQRSQTQRSCQHCGTTETPYWRRGPLGSGTLCQWCGDIWSKHGELRPDYRPRNQCSQTQRSCQHCGNAEAPSWKTGPLGSQTRLPPSSTKATFSEEFH